MPHQTKPGDPASYSYGHTIGDYPELADALVKGEKIPSLEDIKKMRAKDFLLPLSSQGTTIVDTKDTDNFINQQNRLNMGASDTNVLTDFSNMGSLGAFMQPAMAIMDNVYQVDEPTQREKDINMGRMFLKFFTEMGARSSQPGATAVSAGLQAGQTVAEDYINKELKREETKRKQKQAKRLGATTLAMQLKSAKDAKELALAKIKPKVVTLYKMPDNKKAGAKTMQVIEGTAEYLNLTAKGGGYSVDKPDFGSVTDNDFGDKVYIGGIYDGRLLKDVQNENKIDNNENVDTESEDNEGNIVSTKPKLIRLTKAQHSQAKDFRKTIMDQTKDFRQDIQPGYLKIIQFYNNRDPIGDYSLAVGYAKMIDPGSVAREGEVSAVANSGSIPDTLKAQLLNALTGNGRLPQRVRAGIYNRAIEIFNTERKKALEIIDAVNKSWSSQIGRNDQIDHILHYKIEPESELEKVDLSTIPETKDFVFNEEAIKKMTIEQLRDIIAFQNLTVPQLQFIGNLVKEKKKKKKAN